MQLSTHIQTRDSISVVQIKEAYTANQQCIQSAKPCPHCSPIQPRALVQLHIPGATQFPPFWHGESHTAALHWRSIMFCYNNYSKHVLSFNIPSSQASPVHPLRHSQVSGPAHTPFTQEGKHASV